MNTTSPTPADSRRGTLLVLAGSFCISFAAFFVKGAPIDSSAVAFYRFLFGAAAMFAVAVLQRSSLKPSRRLLPFIVMAGLFFIGDVLLWHKSILLLGPGVATIVINFEVIFLALFGVVFLKERLSLQQKPAIPFALLGLALLLGVFEHGLPETAAVGTAFALVASLFYTAYILTVRRTQMLPEKMNPVANMAWITTVTCIGTFGVCTATGVSLHVPDVQTLATLAVLGVFCQSFGWVLLSLGLPLMSPFRAGILMLTQPAMSYLWDCIVYGTATGPLNIVGAIMAIVAIGMGIKNPDKKKGSTT
ncbi:MAG: DMT family transporter [Planctomycetaceae bacterium]|nr:DMT family transporter [Planctomycetaceae bacterium]